MTPSGPDAVNPALDTGSAPTGVPAGTVVTLTASIDDTRYNNSNGTEPTQNIAAAEYYVDTPPWVTVPTPVAIAMSATDGTFDSTLEAAEAVIDTTGTTYAYHVKARDKSPRQNETGWSTSESATPVCPLPDAPAVLTATASACDQIDLSWTDNADNETSFKIERSTDGSIFAEIDSVGAGVTTYNDTTAAELTTYWYRIRASNSCGYSGYSNTAGDTTPECPVLPPTAPSNLNAKALKYTVDLTWTDNANNEDGFRIYRGDSPSTLLLIDTTGPDSTSYGDAGLIRKTYYYYKVCAYNGDGEGCTATIQTKTK